MHGKEIRKLLGRQHRPRARVPPGWCRRCLQMGVCEDAFHWIQQDAQAKEGGEQVRVRSKEARQRDSRLPRQYRGRVLPQVYGTQEGREERLGHLLPLSHIFIAYCVPRFLKTVFGPSHARCDLLEMRRIVEQRDKCIAQPDELPLDCRISLRISVERVLSFPLSELTCECLVPRGRISFGCHKRARKYRSSALHAIIFLYICPTYSHTCILLPGESCRMPRVISLQSFNPLPVARLMCSESVGSGT